MAEPDGNNPPSTADKTGTANTPNVQGAGSRGAAADNSEAPVSAAQFQKELDALKAEIFENVKALSAGPQQPRSSSRFDSFFSRVNDFFSSGFFFILLGGALLFFAWRGLEIGVHSSLSFVLVVLGIAVLLFGTGTQGLGRLDSPAAASRYTVSIAGGAGILAVLIGYGMVKYGGDIQQVFELQTHYAWVGIRSSAQCPLGIDRYWIDVTSDGEPLAYKSQKGEIIVLLPYYYNELKKDQVIKRTIDVEFTVKNPNDLKANELNALCAPSKPDRFEISISALSSQGGSGFDFPRVNASKEASLLKESGVNPNVGLLNTTALQDQASQDQLMQKGAKAPDVQNIPPLSVAQ